MRPLVLGLGFLFVVGCTSAGDSDTKKADFYKARACEDFRELVIGVTDGTMSVSDVIDKLSKMHANTKDAALFDPSLAAWDSAVLRLQADYEDGRTPAPQADIDAVGEQCV
jgi:hypothetical protein